jgi:hypothetical protein
MAIGINMRMNWCWKEEYDLNISRITLNISRIT